jgi:prepilin-type N-terminal cleavage/methylation domain-containing protein/prepilin-type processing-associated H-X9-DG protein
MNSVDPKNSERGMTLIELLVVIAAMVLLVGVLLPALNRNQRRNPSGMSDVNHLKQLGLGGRLFATDNNDQFPWNVSTNSGGTMQYKLDPALAYRHFQVMSNELNDPRILHCPADSQRHWATNWASLRNTNISYFVGIDSSETSPQELLSGDSNLTTNGVAVGTSILQLKTQVAVGWTASRHQSAGNVVLGDGSVQQITSARLAAQVTTTESSTNRILIP